METIVLEFPEHIMSMAELKEFKELQQKIFAGGQNFVEMDWNNPDQVRLNELTPKYMDLRKYYLSQEKLLTRKQYFL